MKKRDKPLHGGLAIRYSCLPASAPRHDTLHIAMLQQNMHTAPNCRFYMFSGIQGSIHCKLQDAEQPPGRAQMHAAGTAPPGLLDSRRASGPGWPLRKQLKQGKACQILAALVSPSIQVGVCCGHTLLASTLHDQHPHHRPARHPLQTRCCHALTKSNSKPVPHCVWLAETPTGEQSSFKGTPEQQMKPPLHGTSTGTLHHAQAFEFPSAS